MDAIRVEDAYRRIHLRLWRALFAYGGDAEIAGDAEAEAFTQAIRRGSEIRDVDAWVWRCAFRIAAGLLQDRRTLGLGDFHLDRPDGGVEDRSVTVFLSQLDGLSDQQRAIVVLRYVGQFRPAEIADLLNTSPGSVRVQLHRAHTHLRSVLEESDG